MYVDQLGGAYIFVRHLEIKFILIFLYGITFIPIFAQPISLCGCPLLENIQIPNYHIVDAEGIFLQPLIKLDQCIFADRDPNVICYIIP